MDPLLIDLMAAREITLDVLERMGTGKEAPNATADAMVALQEAANRLGVAESILQSLPAETPPPVLDPDDPAGAPDPVRWSGEATAAMALAEFTVPYAAGAADEADRWLRVLRREGAVGRALAELGYPDAELANRAEPVTARDLEAVHAIHSKAELLARHRGAGAVTTADILFAVLSRYGALAERALYARGITRESLLDRVSLGARAADTLPA
jgi:hypothetical protein